MASWLRRKSSQCREAQEALQELLNGGLAGGAQEHLAAAPADLRGHLHLCAQCRAIFEDGLAARQLLCRNLPAAEDPGAVFTVRVMGAIAAQEAARMPAANPWFAVPALAARLAWVSAIVLLLASTWLYEVRPAAVDSRAGGESAGASLEPAPQPASQDEVLASLVGREP